MGKRIIIKGADFSENGFYLPNVLRLTEQECTVDSHGIVASSGELSSENQAWKASDFIDIKDLSTLTFTNVNEAANFGLSFYSSSNVSGFISGVAYRSTLVGTTINIPSDAKYMRFCSYVLNPTILALQ